MYSPFFYQKLPTEDAGGTRPEPVPLTAADVIRMRESRAPQPIEVVLTDKKGRPLAPAAGIGRQYGMPVPDDFVLPAPAPAATAAPQEPGLWDALSDGADRLNVAMKSLGVMLADGDTTNVAAELSRRLSMPDPLSSGERAINAKAKAVDDAKGGWATAKAIGDLLWTAVTEPRGTGLMIARNAPYSLPSMASTIAGAGVGALTPIPGGAMAGAMVGALAGSSLTEMGAYLEGAVAEELQTRKLDPTPENVGKVLADKAFKDRVTGEAARKGVTIGAVDALSLKLGGMLISAPARAAMRKTLVDAGVDVADRAAVASALRNPTIAASVSSAMKAAPKTAATAGAFGIETLGEGVGEYGGTYAATGDPSLGEAVVESIASADQSAGQATIARMLSAAKGITQRAADAAGAGQPPAGPPPTPNLPAVIPQPPAGPPPQGPTVPPMLPRPPDSGVIEVTPEGEARPQTMATAQAAAAQAIRDWSNRRLTGPEVPIYAPPALPAPGANPALAAPPSSPQLPFSAPGPIQPGETVFVGPDGQISRETPQQRLEKQQAEERAVELGMAPTRIPKRRRITKAEGPTGPRMDIRSLTKAEAEPTLDELLKASQPKGDLLALKKLKDAGGVSLKVMSDIMGDKSKAMQQLHPKLFRHAGKNADMLVEWFSSQGYINPVEPGHELEAEQEVFDMLRAAVIEKKPISKVLEREELQRQAEGRADLERLWSRARIAGIDTTGKTPRQVSLILDAIEDIDRRVAGVPAQEQAAAKAEARAELDDLIPELDPDTTPAELATAFDALRYLAANGITDDGQIEAIMERASIMADNEGIDYEQAIRGAVEGTTGVRQEGDQGDLGRAQAPSQAEPEAQDEGVAPAADLFGGTGETATQRAVREEQQRRAQQQDEREAEAPQPQDFTLTGSNRPADEGAARGQLDLTDAAKQDEAPPQKPLSPVQEAIRDADRRVAAITSRAQLEALPDDPQGVADWWAGEPVRQVAVELQSMASAVESRNWSRLVTPQEHIALQKAAPSVHSDPKAWLLYWWDATHVSEPEGGDANAEAQDAISEYRAEFGTMPDGMTKEQVRDFHRRQQAAFKALTERLVSLAEQDGLLLPYRRGEGFMSMTPEPGDDTKWRLTRFLKDMTPSGHEVHRDIDEAARNFAYEAGSDTRAETTPSGAPRDEAAYIVTEDYEKSLRDTYFGDGRKLSSRDTPQTAPIPPVGTWRMARKAGADGREIQQLVEIPVDNLEISEDTGPEKWADVEQFAQWWRDWKEPPPIDVIQHDSGSLKAQDHRRLLAAKVLGKDKIKAWVNWTVDTQRDGYSGPTGLTYELAMAGAKQRPVKSARPEYRIFADDAKWLEKTRAAMAEDIRRDGALVKRKGERAFIDGDATAEELAVAFHKMRTGIGTGGAPHPFVGRGADRVLASENAVNDFAQRDWKKALKIADELRAMDGERYEQVTGAPRAMKEGIAGMLERAVDGVVRPEVVQAWRQQEEARNAANEKRKQAGVQQEREGRNEGREAAEAGGGNRVQRQAPGAEGRAQAVAGDLFSQPEEEKEAPVPPPAFAAEFGLEAPPGMNGAWQRTYPSGRNVLLTDESKTAKIRSWAILHTPSDEGYDAGERSTRDLYTSDEDAAKALRAAHEWASGEEKKEPAEALPDDLAAYTVKVPAVDAKTGARGTTTEKADVALARVDEQLNKARMLLECLLS